MIRLLFANLRYALTEWQQRHIDGETWTRLRALWEGK